MGKNTKKIAEHIQYQLKEDELHDQLTVREDTDLFADIQEGTPRRRQTAKNACRRC